MLGSQMVAASSTLSYQSGCCLCSICQALSPWNYLGLPCLQAEQVVRFHIHGYSVRANKG